MLCLLLLLALAGWPADSRFGVVVLTEGRTLAQITEDLDAAARLGVGWVRVQPDWIRLQPARGKFDWAFTEGLVQAARQRKLEVFYTLGNSPRWASRYPDDPAPEVWSRNAPKLPADWRAYVLALALRLGKVVTAWEVWERTSIHYYRGSNKDLVEMARGAMQALRGQARSVFMAEPGLNLGAINELYTWGAQTYFTGLALYPAFERPEGLLRPLSVLQTDIVKKKGPLMRLWIAGTGWAVEAMPGPVKVPVVDENTQARYLIRHTTLALANGVEKVFWHSLRDVTEGPYQAQSRSGLLSAEGRERPAFEAYRKLIEVLGQRPFLASARWGPHAWGYLFGEAGGEAVLVAWSDRPWVQLAPAPAAEVVLGRDPARLGEDPVLLRGSEPALRAWLETPAVQPAASDPDRSGQAEVSAVLGVRAEENGLAVRTPIESVVVRSGGWSTDLANGKSAIMFDVDDTFAYFVDGRHEVEVEVEVLGNSTGLQMGFNLGYDAMAGYSFSEWIWVEPGAAWQTYKFRLKNPDFSDHVSDFRVNALGSKADIVIRAVRVRKYISK